VVEKSHAAGRVTLAVADHIGLITIDQQARLNALTPDMMAQLGAALDEVHRDRQIRAVVITGAGSKAFTTGFDLDGLEMPGGTDGTVASTRANFEIFMKIWNLRVPSIAAVNGHAIAAGVSLAGICDLGVASPNARFGEPEVRHYALAPLLLMPWFTRSPKRANYLYYTGDTIAADEAVELGLINEVVPAEELLPRAMAIAERIAMVPAFAVEMTKESIRRTYETMGFTSALQQHRLLDTLLLGASGIEERDALFGLMAAGDMRGFLAARDGRFATQPRLKRDEPA
jgi:enoyl-CoA hydratase